MRGSSKMHALLAFILFCLISFSTELSRPQLCIPLFNGYELNSLTAKPYWIFKIEEDCNFLPGQEKQCLIYATFCKKFESMLRLVLVLCH